jgi:predicted amino acid racemase
MAELFVDLEKLRHNIKYMCNYCSLKNLELVGVLKGDYALPPLVREFQEGGIKSIGISKASIAKKSAGLFDNKPLFIKLPSLGELKIVTRYFKASLNSELVVIQALAEAAAINSETHGIILMVDNGDLREGVMPEDVLGTVQEILLIKNPHIKLIGLGANLGCLSGTLPDNENLKLIQELALDVETRLGCEIETVSIGGSVMLGWMEDHQLPSKINQIRIGEAILLGNIPIINKKHEDLFDDIFIFKSETLEVKEKPSIPPGKQGKDAFGRKPKMIAKGLRKKAILNFGIADTYPAGLIPCLENLEIIYFGSDYTVVDITNCEQKIEPGDVLKFKMDYRALHHTFLSPFIKTNLIGEK